MAQATNLSRPKREVKLVLRTYVIIALITAHWAKLGTLNQVDSGDLSISQILKLIALSIKLVQLSKN